MGGRDRGGVERSRCCVGAKAARKAKRKRSFGLGAADGAKKWRHQMRPIGFALRTVETDVPRADCRDGKQSGYLHEENQKRGRRRKPAHEIAADREWN